MPIFYFLDTQLFLLWILDPPHRLMGEAIVGCPEFFSSPCPYLRGISLSFISAVLIHFTIENVYRVWLYASGRLQSVVVTWRYRGSLGFVMSSQTRERFSDTYFEFE